MTARQQRRPDGAESRMRSIRVPVEVYDGARDAAARNGETLSAAVVAFLRRYARK